MARKGKTLEQKLDNVDEHFCDEVRNLAPDLLKDRLVKLDNYEAELLEARENDHDLKSLSFQVSEARKTYSEPLSAVKLKRKYILKMINGDK